MNPFPQLKFSSLSVGSPSFSLQVPRLSRAMRQLAIVLPFLLLFLGRASADYYDGLRAYESGDYLVAAEEWYMAGSQGDVTAQFRLAQLYEQGLGAPQDFVEAHRWYNIAASLGHAEARKARDELGTRFTTDQLAEAQRLAKLTQVHLQEAANAPPDISSFDGHWKAGAQLHYSSPKMKCGYQVIDLRILDGQVKGNLKIGSAHFRDSAAGDYLFSGTIDQKGNVRAKGHGVSITGAISQETSTLSGSWDAFGVSCRGTYEGTKEW